VHLTQRLLAALKKHQHDRGPRVFGVTQKVMAGWVAWAERKAGLPVAHGLHKLRHTFCSHLAIRAPHPAPSRSSPAPRRVDHARLHALEGLTWRQDSNLTTH